MHGTVRFRGGRSVGRREGIGRVHVTTKATASLHDRSGEIRIRAGSSRTIVGFNGMGDTPPPLLSNRGLLAISLPLIIGRRGRRGILLGHVILNASDAETNEFASNLAPLGDGHPNLF